MRSLAAFVTAIALAACAHAETAVDDAAAHQIAAGQHLAEMYCSTCHAIGAAGESRHPLAPPFHTLSEKYPVTMLEEAFAEGVLVGHRDMPEFRLEPEEIDQLIAYLQSVQTRRGG